GRRTERVHAHRLCRREPVLAREGERGPVVALGTHAVVVRDLDRGAEVERAPFERDVAETSREGQSLLDLGEAEPLVARAELDRGVSEQRLDALGRCGGRAFERYAEPVERLRQLDAAEPEGPDARGQP